jgi:hypothetical protein
MDLEQLIGRFFEHGCKLVVDAQGYFQQVVVPLLESGPTGMLAFGLRDPAGDFEAAVSEIAKHGADWRGYLFLSSRIISSRGRETWAVVLEIVHDEYNPACLLRRYEIDDAGKPAFIDEHPCETSTRPPDRRDPREEPR